MQPVVTDCIHPAADLSQLTSGQGKGLKRRGTWWVIGSAAVEQIPQSNEQAVHLLIFSNYTTGQRGVARGEDDEAPAQRDVTLMDEPCHQAGSGWIKSRELTFRAAGEDERAFRDMPRMFGHATTFRGCTL